MKNPPLYLRNKARAKFNKALIPVLAQISARIQHASDERRAIALFRITGKKVATVATRNKSALQIGTEIHQQFDRYAKQYTLTPSQFARACANLIS